MVRRGIAAVAAAVVLLASPAYARPHAGYRIPPGNPFTATPGARPEVYLLGVRNPYRWSFDSATGDMYVGDVGAGAREEITYLPRRRIAGANLGWPCREGTVVVTACRLRGYVPPAYEYRDPPDVVIGGFVVHDPGLPSLLGRYLYGRYQSGLWALGPRATGAAVNTGLPLTGVTGVSQDSAGRLYVSEFDGPVYRLGEASGHLTLATVGAFERPLGVTTPAGEPDHLFVFEKGGRVLERANGLWRTFLDISDRVRDVDYEQGLVGFALAPDYATSGRAFAVYSDNAGDWQLDEYRRGARVPLLRIRHRESPNHYGGQALFGADGYLYVSTGDGDLDGDRNGDAQGLDSLLGKILRLDVADAGPDRSAPRVRERVARAQRVLRLGGAVAYVTCSERCAIVAGARLRIRGRSYRLEPVGAELRARRESRVKVPLGKRVRRALRRALERDRRVSVRVVLRAEDPTGNRSPDASATARVTG